MDSGHVNRGLVKWGVGDARVIDLPMPKLRNDYILVKTVAVALNPTDWQDLETDFKPGSTPLLIGCDYAGVVEEIGEGVTKSLKVGDRVMGCLHGTNEENPEDGAFAEYIMGKGDTAVLIPPNLSFTSAATLPCGLGTAALALYKHLEIPLLPATTTATQWILIYGGSTASGSIAIQFAKLSGLKVVTTCSERNFGFVRGLGVDAVFDYRDPSCAKNIRDLTADNLTLVLDTIANDETAKISADSMSSTKGGIYCNLMGTDSPREDVKSVFFLGWTGLGERYSYGGEEWPFVSEDYEISKKVISLAEGLLQKEKLKPHPAAIRPGGLKGIVDGLNDLKNKRVSGEKLVYVIRDLN